MLFKLIAVLTVFSLSIEVAKLVSLKAHITTDSIRAVQCDNFANNSHFLNENILQSNQLLFMTLTGE